MPSSVPPSGPAPASPPGDRPADRPPRSGIPAPAAADVSGAARGIPPFPLRSSVAEASGDEVPVRTRVWCTATMVPGAMLCCLAQVSFAAQPYVHAQSGGRYLWLVLSTLLAFAFPFLLLARDRHPRAVFWSCLATVAVFPYDPMLALMALSSLLARRSSLRGSVVAVAATAAVSVGAQLRDALQPPDASLWHMVVFARPDSGTQGAPAEMMAGEGTIVATAVVVALAETAVATLVGLHIRSRAGLRTASARADAAATHAATLQQDLDSQQLADAIAAEAHDTLAHSLSLLALNASALQAEASALGDCPQAQDLALKARDIRRQAAGALDEAHSIIDMLRHPAVARTRLVPSAETSLTRESLDGLVGEARSAGMRLDTWIDIRQLGELDDAVSRIAYRAVQEGLTNARRHAPGMPVALQVDAAPERGVHVHLSNPTSVPARLPVPAPAPSPVGSPTAAGTSVGRGGRPGAGLPGLAARVRSAGGACAYGLDGRRAFHVDVRLPWRRRDEAADSRPPAGTMAA